MTEPTQQDRERALKLSLSDTPVADIATALAAERERAEEDKKTLGRKWYESEAEVERLEAENKRLREALQAMRDHAVEYARINNLFNVDGSPATFHELLQANAALGDDHR